MLKTKTKTRAEAGTGTPTSSGEPFGVYVHWPFCAAKCPYCDFNSHVRHGGIDAERFLAGYLRELSHFAQRAAGRSVTSVFFGGGTPSLMPPRITGAILDAIASHWTLDRGAEITLEANPTSVEAANFRGYAAAGVNRLSLGVQALDDASLTALGRLHTADEALAALRLARQTFGRVSFDLIYAREGQSRAAWKDELSRALGFAADHLSLYQLTIEDGTPFAALYEAGRLRPPESEDARAMYLLTQEVCEAAGLPAYEISNHAVPGSESRHNLLYWRGHDYAGIGAGAHARVTQDGVRHALSTLRLPEAWLEQVEVQGHGLASDETLTASEAAEEYLLMALRLVEGLDMARFAALGGAALDEALIETFVAEGLLRRNGTRLTATPSGRVVLERLILELAA
ncbi:radical SAM family heme chaperone HemW [Methyloceanibacter sp.]|uniref:radical SAM family heme chaperone HemW n=1 Tax=Methyloceanibacter sp. TaxID=1965321 RepID=UPI002CB48213|nr:radical SAM family heme chaperone HemW [Methyloceanibacter sp.]HML91493.1 radical SAM family heme chaperone HemW [Methyloceanibacter sp.]